MSNNNTIQNIKIRNKVIKINCCHYKNKAITSVKRCLTYKQKSTKHYLHKEHVNF